ICYPNEDDSIEKLSSKLNKCNLPEKTLIEVMMIAPQWVKLVSQYLEIKGLEEMMWFVLSHSFGYLDEERLNNINKYVKIQAEDIINGEFDLQWFKNAHNNINEKTFKLVYNASKLIKTDNSEDVRLRLLIDIVLGKVNKEDAKIRIESKRSKNYLLAYGLVKINGINDVIERYKFIEKFKKEAKKFGAARRSSEELVANIAIKNLINNAGYKNSMQLKAILNNEMNKEIEKYIEPCILDNVEISLNIENLEKPSITCKKDNKILKGIPARLKKHEYLILLNEICKDIREQYKGLKENLHEAMKNEEEFSYEEIHLFSKSKVSSSLIKRILFKINNKFGFIEDNKLITNNDEIDIKEEDIIYVAHPIDLNSANLLDYYKKIIEKYNIVQPFKQIFRPIYIMDETKIVNGYEYLIEGRKLIEIDKTYGILKSMGWIRNYVVDMKKICYKKNIIVNLFDNRTTLTSMNITGQFIDKIVFQEQKYERIINPREVPKILFSEIMMEIQLSL
ncbi:MAG: DUF5724 domain-containing protein, partial [Clostridium sp.]